MDGLQHQFYSTVNHQINFMIYFMSGGNQTGSFFFKSWQTDDFQPEHASGDIKTLEITETRSSADEYPEREDGAVLQVVEVRPVTWGLPNYRVQLLLQGLVFWDGVVEVPTGTPAFRLDGTWTRNF